MKMIKLDGGVLFNLDFVGYIKVYAEYSYMTTMDGNEDWNDAFIRQVWAALQDPNTVCEQSHAAQLMNITPRERMCKGCGKMLKVHDFYYEMVHGVFHADCVPKKP